MAKQSPISHAYTRIIAAEKEAKDRLERGKTKADELRSQTRKKLKEKEDETISGAYSRKEKEIEKTGKEAEAKAAEIVKKGREDIERMEKGAEEKLDQAVRKVIEEVLGWEL